MMDRIKVILKKVLDWWNKFTSKQKTIIICVAVGVLLVFAGLITILSRPQYTLLTTSASTKESSEVKTLLDDNDIQYTVSDDGLTFNVLSNEISAARILLGASDITTTAYDLDTVFSGGFSTTEADKIKKYKLYLESKMEEDLLSFDSVKEASVDLSLPESDGTLIAEAQDASAAVLLYIDGAFTQDNAAAMAQFIATGLGNDSTNNITIIDQEGTLWFSGEDSYSVTGGASTQISVTEQLNGIMATNIKKVLIGTPLYGNVEVAGNLVIDFSNSELVTHTYTNTDNVKSSESTGDSTSTSGTGGTPGTDSNSQTTYVYPSTSTTSSTDSTSEIYYLPDEVINTQTIPAGLVKYDTSSISVAATSYKVVKQADAKAQGLLAGLTWTQYKLANAAPVKLTVDAEIYDLVSKATGIATANISIVAYEETFFEDTPGLNISFTNVVQIALIVLIVGLLLFVVLRTMRGEKALAPEEELSVESLLQSAPEPDMQDIELEEKSKTRKMIEKFVDDNPEAVANLMRNWLSEDWG